MLNPALSEPMFKSRAHYTAFALAFTDGEIRMRLLGIGPLHYKKKVVAEEWLIKQEEALGEYEDKDYILEHAKIHLESLFINMIKHGK